MKIIGEKINGTIEQVRKAVENRDASFIQTLAKRQVEAGAYWLDVNAGTPPDREPDDLVWLVQTVQTVIDTPLCLDSANSNALETAIQKVKQPPLINSINGETKRLESTLPIVRDNNCEVIALAMDDKGIPGEVEGRMSVVRNLMEKTREAGLADDKVYIDPLVTAIATGTESGQIVLRTMRKVRAEFPEVHFSMGLSNISFGMPARTSINQAFLILAISEGLDSAIMDPLNKKMQEALLAAELVLGQDQHCLNYTRAYRAGKIGNKAKS
jgi:5-methyltetrahydrofolate--homocysteine methyltransferase